MTEPDPLDPLDLERLEAAARARLDPPVYDYLAGGADAEHTVAGNLAAWPRLALRPHVLRDVAKVSTIPLPMSSFPMSANGPIGIGPPNSSAIAVSTHGISSPSAAQADA